MTELRTASPVVLAGLYSTRDLATATLPVDLPTDTWRTLLRTVVPVDAGDWLDITAWARVTNDILPLPAYTVGLGWHLWAYDCDTGLGTAGPWWRVSPSCGDNVERTRHHLPLHIDTLYQVPADWPLGHRIVIVLRADAHSTQWKAGDCLKVDQLGVLTVRRYTPAPIPEA